ncbi:MAG: hypothetical protein ACRDVG_07845, partial [Jatrophihabitantaceae bacterium]
MAGPNRERLDAVADVAVRLLGLALVGMIVGLVLAVATPAKLEVAGSSTSLYLKIGRGYDQFGVEGVLTGKHATTRAVLGEPVGVQGDLELDASELTDSSGQFNVDILPAYIQAYSDTDQLVRDARQALVLHFAVFAVLGAAGAAALGAARRGYRAWRHSYDRTHWPDRADVRAAARAYRAPERRMARRAAFVLIALVVFETMPSSVAAPGTDPSIVGTPIFAGTPLDGVEVDGLLRPALVAAESYIEKYFEQTNTYYDQLRTRLEDYLAANPVQLPGDENSVQLGLVSDRHCNIGMDRVIVAMLDHFGVHTLVSAGDDAFSGSFGFEAACTRNLADKTVRADISDVFVGGNHDSPGSIADERHQGITTLTGDVVHTGELRFVGVPDPRTSRYGHGIVPSSDAAQQALLTAQGEAAGRTACGSSGPVIAVLHDPLAGRTALEHGCGKIVLALDGHTHKEGEPTTVRLPDAGTGYQFTSGSTGGAPTESAIESTFASQLTVGPLNHDAWMNIVTVDAATGQLQGATT